MSDLLPDRPVVDDARILEVYKEIRAMPEIVLDADPLAAGPSRMNNKKAQIRNQLSRCTALELQVLQDRGWFQRELTREQAKYDIAYTDLLANNPHVRAGRSTADREAAARVILVESVRNIKELELAVEDLERLLKVINTKQRDLRNLQIQLKDQLRICEHELNIDGKWGRAGQSSSGYAVADDRTVDDLLEIGGPMPEEDSTKSDDSSEESEEEEEEDSTNPDDSAEESEESEEDSEDSGEGSSTVLELYEGQEKAESALPGSASDDETDTFLDSFDPGEAAVNATPEDPGEIDVDSILDGLDYAD